MKVTHRRPTYIIQVVKERAIVEAGGPVQVSAPKCAQNNFCHILWAFKDHKGAREILRVLAALPEDPGSMPSSHIMVYITPVPGALASAAGASINLHRHRCIRSTGIDVGEIPIHIKKNNI